MKGVRLNFDGVPGQWRIADVSRRMQIDGPRAANSPLNPPRRWAMMPPGFQKAA